MEFHEKLQELRKQKGLTQEELAQQLFVSRTAISKWESGRGYPSIDSLKAIAKFFSVTIDDLLSGDQILTLAEEDQKEKNGRLRSLIFGLLDCSALLYLFLPLFGEKTDGGIYAFSLLSFTTAEPYILASYYVLVAAMTVIGILTLALLSSGRGRMMRLSFPVSGAATLLFIVSLQPYAAAVQFVFLAIKAVVLMKKQ